VAVSAVVLASLGRGYIGRHRLAQAALGRPVVDSDATAAPFPVHLLPTRGPATPPRATVVPGSAQGTPGPALVPGRASVAPWLRVVPTPAQPDPLADTLPHPVVMLLPPRAASTPAGSTTGEASSVSLLGAEAAVFAVVDAERERAVTAELAAGADVRTYRARHTA
jgi:hypothetical protein